ncbi:MAG: asparaginase [Bryobacteraceae bacterium]
MEIVFQVHLISTGGTLEKIYHEQTGALHNTQSKLDRYLRQLRLPQMAVEVHPLMNIDSLDMTDDHRRVILESVETQLPSADAILITHGTDTMVTTGQFLKDKLTSVSKPIVMTGAMAPLGFEGSDGLQNVTESLIAARLLAPGIFLVFHNQIFPIDRVRKDRELARFVPA